MTHTISRGSIQRWTHPLVQSLSPSPSRIINLQIPLVRLLSRGIFPTARAVRGGLLPPHCSRSPRPPLPPQERSPRGDSSWPAMQPGGIWQTGLIEPHLCPRGNALPSLPTCSTQRHRQSQDTGCSWPTGSHQHLRPSFSSPWGPTEKSPRTAVSQCPPPRPGPHPSPRTVTSPRAAPALSYPDTATGLKEAGQDPESRRHEPSGRIPRAGG